MSDFYPLGLLGCLVWVDENHNLILNRQHGILDIWTSWAGHHLGLKGASLDGFFRFFEPEKFEATKAS